LWQPYLFPNDPESIVRQFLVGKRVVRELLGAEVVTYAAQEPAFTTQLPQLLTGLGYRYVKLQNRWMDFGGTPALDRTLFWWRGPDGSKILASPRYSAQEPVAYWATEAYGSKGLELYPSRSQMEALYSAGVIAPLLTVLEDLLPEHLAPWPGWDLLEHPLWFVRWATPREYFEELLTAHPRKSAFPLSEHSLSIDSLVSNPWPGAPEDFLPFPWGIAGGGIQRDTRLMETVVPRAEKWAALASRIAGASYPESALASLWERLLEAQNHDAWVTVPQPDTLAGLREAVVRDADRLARTALESLAAKVDTTNVPARDPGATPIVVFNPVAHAVRAVAEFPVPVGGAENLTVAAASGTPVPAQLAAAEISSGAALAVVDLPPVGFATYYLVGATAGHGQAMEGEAAVRAMALEDAILLENEWCTLEIDLVRGGAVRRWFDKKRRKLYFPSHTLGGYLRGYFPSLQSWATSLDQRARGRILESGPVRAVVEIGNESYPIPYTLRVHLTAASARVEFEFTLDFPPALRVGSEDYGTESWRANAPKLGVYFPLPPDSGPILRDAPLHSEPTSEKAFWALRFAAPLALDGGWALLTDRPAAFVRHEDALSMVLAYAGPYALGNPVLGPRQRYRFALVPIEPGDTAVQSSLAAAEWIGGTPPSIVTSVHPGPLAPTGTLLAVSGDLVELLAAFVDAGQLVLRLFNPRGQPATVTIRDRAEAPAAELDLRGSPLRPLDAGKLSMRPFGLHTVALGAAPRTIPPPTPSSRSSPSQPGPDEVLALLALPAPSPTALRLYFAAEQRLASRQPTIPQARKDAVTSSQPAVFSSGPLPVDLALRGTARVRAFVATRTGTPPAAEVSARVLLRTGETHLATGEGAASLADCEPRIGDDFRPLCILPLDFELPIASEAVLRAREGVEAHLWFETVPRTRLFLLYESTLTPSFIELPAPELLRVRSVRITREENRVEVELEDGAGSKDIQDVAVVLLDPTGRPIPQAVSADYIADLSPAASLWRFESHSALPTGGRAIAVARTLSGSFAFLGVPIP